MKKACLACQAKLEEWHEVCDGCGYTVVLEPEEKIRAQYLRTPALGALFFTQGWFLGARLYILFALSLIPIVGIPLLVIGITVGRRLSWKFGGWSDWNEFQQRMRLLDLLGIVWLASLVVIYFVFKK
jgi:hypothetical protein